MKKVLAFLLAGMLLFGSMAFASYTEELGLGGMPVQLTDLDQIVRIYPQKLVDFSNLAVLEYGITMPWGYINLDIGSGVLGIGAGPNPGISQVYVSYLSGTLDAAPGGAVITTGEMKMGGIPWTLPYNIVSLMYAMNMDSMKIGIGLIYGMDKSYSKDKKVGGVEVKDVTKDIMSSFLKLTLGASLAGDLPINAALSIALPGYSSNPKYYNAAGNLTDDDFKKLSGLELGVNVGTTLSDIMIELGVTLKSLKSEAQNWLDAGGDGTADTNEYYTSEDSQTNIDILVGKKIKANETLTVLIGSGLNISLFGDTKATLEDKVAGTKEYSAGRDSGMEIVLPLQVAVQCKLNETWSWSAGVNKDIFSMISANNKDVDTTDGSTVTDESDASSMAIDDYLIGSICLTGQFGDLKVQWLFNYNLLLAGPYFISGQNNSWAYNFALVYDWK